MLINWRKGGWGEGGDAQQCNYVNEIVSIKNLQTIVEGVPKSKHLTTIAWKIPCKDIRHVKPDDGVKGVPEVF